VSDAEAAEGSDTLAPMPKLATALRAARRLFYELGGPWYRCRAFEAFGSDRYSHPALFDMDRRLAEIFDSRPGVFVEAGAHDGYTQSNTYYLERRCGWSGVLVEPVPQMRARCERRRPHSQVFGCALVGPERDGTSIAMQLGDLMSTISSPEQTGNRTDGPSPAGEVSMEVPARTLASVLDEAEAGEVDLLVLDLEGAELDAISGLDIHRHAPRYVLVEALDRAGQQPALDAALAGRYEFVQTLSDYDLLYRRRE
jgi:FkbM family methyltransferase